MARARRLMLRNQLRPWLLTGIAAAATGALLFIVTWGLA